MIKNPLWLAATVTAYILGIGTGILAVREYMERKYREIAQEEIDSVKAAFAEKKKEENGKAAAEKQEKDKPPDEKPPLPGSAEFYKQVIADSRRRREENPEPELPYIIEAEDFELDEDYAKITMNYYADGILTDENGEVVDGEDDIFRSDFPNHFNDDCVYVRDDRSHCDYEILSEVERYCDIAG